MVNTHYLTDGVLNAALTSTSTTPEFALGTRAKGNKGSEWMYVRANGAVTAYDCVAIDETWDATAMTKALADADLMVGFAQNAFADNEYGWVALSGQGISVRVLASGVADAALYPSATAGCLDDDATSQTAVNGVVITTTNGGSTAAVAALATYPRTAT